MIVYFNISSGGRWNGSKIGRIEKQTKHGPVPMTVDDAREAWRAGTIEDCNIAFTRLATHFDFDVKKCLHWYEDNQ